MRFLHISDLHLGKTFPVSRYGQQFAHRRRQELLDTFSRLIDFANQNQVDLSSAAATFLTARNCAWRNCATLMQLIERLEHAVIVAISGIIMTRQTKNQRLSED